VPEDDKTTLFAAKGVLEGEGSVTTVALVRKVVLHLELATYYTLNLH
jgi:hypothetical protein